LFDSPELLALDCYTQNVAARHLVGKRQGEQLNIWLVDNPKTTTMLTSRAAKATTGLIKPATPVLDTGNNSG